MRPVEAIVDVCVRRPWHVLAVAALLTGLSLWVALTRFAINTDTASLISPSLPWRQAEIAFDRAFPQRTELIVVVVDGRTPEIAEEAAERLSEALRGDPGTFRNVDRPDGGPFFAKNGLIFLLEQELKATLDSISEQAGLLSILAADPTLRGLARTLGATLVGLRTGDITLEELAPRYEAFAEAIEAALAGKPARLSWQSLVSGHPPGPGDLRKIVLVRPVMDYGALQPGAAATDVLRRKAAELGLLPENGVTIRLTGPVPLADEEFATVAENMTLNIGLTLLAVGIILWLALRSPKLILAVLVTLFAGLIVTSALGLLAVGRLNLISVAFFVLFIGLGVDFGIQYAVRYRAERHNHGGLGFGLRAAGREVGFPLTLAALSLIAGFLSFLPTDFSGVSELGLIAGMGMAVAYLASFTLLPALIEVLRPGPERAPVETAWLAHVDHWIARHRPLVIGITAAVVLAGMPALLNLRFDSDPMNLRDPRVESVATFRDLASRPETSPTTLDILYPSLEAARADAVRIAALPEVQRVASLDSFVPPNQEEKLAMLRAAEPGLAAVLDPDAVPPPNPDETATALRQTAEALRKAAEGASAPGGPAASRLAASMDRLAAAPAEGQQAALKAVLTDFDRLVATLRTAFTAEKITHETLPREIVESWVAPDGKARLEVQPKHDLSDPAAAEAFVAAVRSIAPHASGAPVTIRESGATIVRAFTEAGLYSLVAITIILWIAMRRLWDVALAIGPLILAGILTLQTAQLVGLHLNFANIIALPLMFGVGVAFHIYYLIAWRQGVADVLASSLTRAIFFSALTTGIAFGSLWASSHPGTASMGELLAISLVFTLLAAFFVVPAFLGPPRKDRQLQAA
ncbi:MMPL family transporter [Enterovirga aerilata]|uniref:MMPL family transporter n=1 Tax=Enterovirga aerilata TaxID=2730920 RepID=A0A849ID34_9HYPH|nr:MMPL family transporter [Enterovirga sp. DB1703]NNM71823.1 MMPL family transporter [Enterovirga sp. DB1703]